MEQEDRKGSSKNKTDHQWRKRRPHHLNRVGVDYSNPAIRDKRRPTCQQERSRANLGYPGRLRVWVEELARSHPPFSGTGKAFAAPHENSRCSVSKPELSQLSWFLFSTVAHASQARTTGRASTGKLRGKLRGLNLTPHLGLGFIKI